MVGMIDALAPETNPMLKTVIAGGSGFIGSALTSGLVAAGREVVVLSRGTHAPKGARNVLWDARTLGGWQTELEGAEAVVNLAGRPIACRWTARNRQEILNSRLDSTRALAQAISECVLPPKTWINAAAVGIYGDMGDADLDENADTAHARGFLADVCRAWEHAVEAAATPRTRKVKLRIGFVLAARGGALPVLARLTRCFLGGSAGSGRQYVSWIHFEDLVRLIEWLLDNDVEGPVNATAPSPVTNAELMCDLRRAWHKPWSPAVPAPVLRLAGKLVGPDAELVLAGQRILPGRALSAGFSFKFAALDQALNDLSGPI